VDKLRKYTKEEFLEMKLKELKEVLLKHLPEEDYYYLLNSKYMDLMKLQC